MHKYKPWPETSFTVEEEKLPISTVFWMWELDEEWCRPNIALIINFFNPLYRRLYTTLTQITCHMVSYIYKSRHRENSAKHQLVKACKCLRSSAVYIKLGIKKTVPSVNWCHLDGCLSHLINYRFWMIGLNILNFFE